MNHARTFRMLMGGLATALVVGTVGVGAAEARPTKPGGVTGLAAVVTPGDLTYTVVSSWNPVPKATGYRASLTKGGTTLATKTVTGTSWTTTLNTSPGTATLAVQAVIGHHKGRPSTGPVQLLDVTKPNGSFSTTWSNVTGAATLTQDSLTDDSPASLVSRSVDWGDGSPAQSWTVGTTLGHTYTLTPAQQVTYQPTVTLTDAATNARTVDAAPIVFNDFVAPVGSFGDVTGTVWAKLTKVSVTQTALSDNRTADADIARTVDWGDGSPLQSWTAGTTVNHVYTTGGSFVPVVHAEDQAHNVAVFSLSAVTVKVDAVAPVVKLLFSLRHQHSVRAWRLLRGKATDTNGTGVKLVHLRAVEKRGTKWFGYRPATRTWVRAATKAAAFKKGRAFSLVTGARHRWSAKLVGLRKGTLVYKVSAVDLVHNTSRPVIHKVRLTKP